MFFRQYCDPETCTFTYFLGDPDTKQALVIDPVLEWILDSWIRAVCFRLVLNLHCTLYKFN